VIVVWTPEAEQDRADIWDYIADDNPSAAVRMDAFSALRLLGWPRIRSWARRGRLRAPANW